MYEIGCTHNNNLTPKSSSSIFHLYIVLFWQNFPPSSCFFLKRSSAFVKHLSNKGSPLGQPLWRHLSTFSHTIFDVLSLFYVSVFYIFGSIWEVFFSSNSLLASMGVFGFCWSMINGQDLQYDRRIEIHSSNCSSTHYTKLVCDKLQVDKKKLSPLVKISENLFQGAKKDHLLGVLSDPHLHV